MSENWWFWIGPIGSNGWQPSSQQQSRCPHHLKWMTSARSSKVRCGKAPLVASCDSQAVFLFQCCRVNCGYLVGGLNPSEKYESIGMIIPKINGKIKVMFQSPPTSDVLLQFPRPTFHKRFTSFIFHLDVICLLRLVSSTNSLGMSATTKL